MFVVSVALLLTEEIGIELLTMPWAFFKRNDRCPLMEDDILPGRVGETGCSAWYTSGDQQR